MSSKNVFLGLSGGVDSAIAAFTLIQEGENVTGVHILNLPEDTSKYAKIVSEQLKVPLLIWDFRKDFEKEVINSYKKALKQGLTPNPCVICNEKIKFGRFLQECLKEGADYISTGHYARVDNGRLLRGSDPTRDQSYFLYRLNKKILKKTLFPLGNMTKNEVRKIAKETGLKTTASKESQDICFIQNSNVHEYIRQNIKESPGIIFDFDTKEEVGEHSGVHFYTIGQRKGIKIGGTKKPYYVVDKNIKSNILYVGMGKDHKTLWKKKILITDESWTDELPLENNEYLAQIRYKQEPVKCRYSKGIVTLNKPVYAPTNGQSLVLYDRDRVVRGGLIC